jgi:hypothetical protein
MKNILVELILFREIKIQKPELLNSRWTLLVKRLTFGLETPVGPAINLPVGVHLALKHLTGEERPFMQDFPAETLL